MSSSWIKPLILFLLLVSSFATTAAAQDGEKLRSFLEDLLQQRQSPAEQRSRPQNKNQETGRPDNKAIQRRVPFGRSEMQLSFAPLVARTAPAVVNVYAARTQTERRSPFEGDPFFEQFFGRQFDLGRPQMRTQSSLGSGVIVDASGLIITNNHVIEGMDQIKVGLSDGREFESQVVLRDERADLAVLRIDSGEALPILPFAETDQLLIGDLVLAIGNPFGVGQTITSGIVSAIARSQVGVSDFGFFIQTDAAINPGNSGGALVDMEGRLVGINTAIFSRSGGSNGIGFAIPANMVRAVVAQAKGGADAFERPFIGASFDVVTAEMAESLGMRRPSGAIVTNLADNGPAARAGLRVGDVVLSINSQRVEHRDALGYRLATLSVGDIVDMDVFSRGELVSIKLRLAKPPREVEPVSVVLGGNTPFSGATISLVTPQILRQLRIQGDVKGVVITDIDRRSNAARAGFLPGDIVESVNGVTIENVAILQKLVADGGRSWRFRLNRGGSVIQQFLRF